MTPSLITLITLTISHLKRVFRTFNRANLEKFFYHLKTSDFSTLKEKVVRQITRPYHDYPLPLQILPLFNYIKEIKEISFPVFAKSRVSIIIPVWNKWNYTYRCLQAILENTAVDIQYEIILVDNASTDETSEMLEHIKNIKVIANRENLGFVNGCNTGAAEAKGEYILFLNNDTQVTTGWLNAMVDLIERDKAIGLVGAKLIYPDGRLQEAGGIVWNDPVNMAWNYGRYDDPNKWEYNYVKEVDYCSGAALLISKYLWDRVGGFDPQFSPAYCEDSDLAFKIRKEGYRLLYQPKAEVVHFEGITSGTDTSRGIKRYQVINQEKFYEKWRTTLGKEHLPNGKDAFLARDRSQEKKVILFIDHYVPTYDKDAGSLTTFMYLKLLVELGFKIIFIPDNYYRMEPYTTELQQMGIEVVYGKFDFKDWICKNGRYIDYAWTSRPHITINYLEDIKSNTRAKILYYTHDLHYLREMRKYEMKKNKTILSEANKWRAMEFKIFENVDVILTPSDVEADIIKQSFPGKKVTTIPAYFYEQIPAIRPSFSQRKDIIFLGGFRHLPNVDAVEYFINDVWPFIKKELPDVKFHIVGSEPPESIKKLASDDVVVTGYVEDIGQYFDKVRVTVAPLRYGAGVKGKIVTSMLYGVPVVTTNIGNEGINLIDGEHCLISDNPADFASRVVNLYKDQALWEIISHNSVKFVSTYFSKGAAKECLLSTFKSADLPTIEQSREMNNDC